MIAKGYKSVSKQEVLSRVSESQILAHYFHIYEVPTLINSPLRQDNNASMGIYSPNGKDINYKDFGTSETGSIFTLLKNLWKVDYHEVYSRILKEVNSNTVSAVKTCRVIANKTYHKSISLDVKVREWRDYDLQWWGQYGITKKWLNYAEVYPISHIIITKNNQKNVFPADKLAYVYIERKEGRITKKIYQPLNTKGHKWSQDNDKSVLGLWTMLPKSGSKVCICSSVKDALTLICNCHIPAICLQGEGMPLSITVCTQLKERFETVLIALDGDTPGVEDSKKLSKETGFPWIQCPYIEISETKVLKDWADIRSYYGKDKLIELFNTSLQNE